MLHDDVYLWLCQGIRRQQVLVALRQPLTSKQLALGLELSLKRCSAIVWELRIYGLVDCLNPRAQRSRVYGLTPRGFKQSARASDANRYSWPSANR